jgi:hypothetical protein
VPVFDVSQTTGPALPDIVTTLHGHAPEGVFATLTDFAEGIGFVVERPGSLESGANGDTDFGAGRIRVAASNDEAQQVKTLAHEIGHALLHDPTGIGARELTRAQRELEAESVAYVICRALGVASDDYSFGYVVGWSGGGDEAIRGIKASTTRIQRAAAAVMKGFESLEPVVEAVNVLSAGVSREEWRNHTVALEQQQRWRGYGTELASLYDITEERKSRQAGRTVKTSPRSAPAITPHLNGVDELIGLDAPMSAHHELEI